MQGSNRISSTFVVDEEKDLEKDAEEDILFENASSGLANDSNRPNGGHDGRVMALKGEKLKNEDEDLGPGTVEEEDEEKGWIEKMGCEGMTFVIILFAFEFAMVFFSFFLMENGQDRFIEDNKDVLVTGDDGTLVPIADETVKQYYGAFVDVAVMIFIGFGLLMAFMRKAGLTSMSLAFLLAIVSAQWALFVVGYSEILVEVINEADHIYEFVVLNIPMLIKSLFAAAAVLISMGVIIGKFSPLQMILFVILEIPIYALNVSIVEGLLHVNDVGGSMLVHTFGAYFGIFLSWVATPTGIHKKKEYKENLQSTRVTDFFSLTGTVILWVYWPSFCGALETTYQHRVVTNTYLCLTSGVIIVFALSRLMHRKFGMEELQNSTLAAGVAIGSIANMEIPVGAPIGIGLTAGAVSFFGYTVIQPLLEKIYIDDTCGVHNLHGLPGIIGGISGAIGVTLMKDVEDFNHHGQFQVLIQFAGLGITVTLAAIGGTLVGLMIRGLGSVKDFAMYPNEAKDFYEDEAWFFLEEENEEDEKDEKIIIDRVMDVLGAQQNLQSDDEN